MIFLTLSSFPDLRNHTFVRHDFLASPPLMFILLLFSKLCDDDDIQNAG